jgi:hypothetical protein
MPFAIAKVYTWIHRAVSSGLMLQMKMRIHKDQQPKKIKDCVSESLELISKQSKLLERKI